MGELSILVGQKQTKLEEVMIVSIMHPIWVIIS